MSPLSGLIPQQQQAVVAAQPQVVTPPTELLQLELRTQQLKDESLWNYSYKKAVGLMVRKNPPPRWTSLWSLTAVTRRPAEQRRAAFCKPAAHGPADRGERGNAWCGQKIQEPEKEMRVK